MNPWLALLAVGAACWSAWRELAVRTPDLYAALPLFMVIGALSVPLLRASEPRTVPAAPLVFLLIVYALAVIVAPPLLRIAPATLALCYCLHAAHADGAPRASFYGLTLLALPVLPSLEFYAAYPVRLAAVHVSAALLRMNGIAVGTEGLALRFGTQLVQFDAPCSGVRMLWTCWFLASALAYLYRFPWWRYALTLLLAALIAIAGNILRATSLFYLEANLLAVGEVPWLHDAVGIAAFCLTALVLCLLVRPPSRAVHA